MKIKVRFYDKFAKRMVFIEGVFNRLPFGVEDLSEPMLFTGLKDKTGKEIYEGDIVKSSGEYKIQPFNFNNEVKSPYWEISTILFDSGCFKRIIYSQHNSYFGELPSNPINIFESHVYQEVIGNIHENIELLGGINEN